MVIYFEKSLGLAKRNRLLRGSREKKGSHVDCLLFLPDKEVAGGHR
jgi:hypothetical protein